MKHARKRIWGYAAALGCGCAALTLCADARAIAADAAGNPYQSIVDRNAFGLKPPPPPPDPEANKPPPPKITLTGITTILGRKLALMKTPPAAPKPGETPKGEQYYMLAEAQRDGEMEVLEIDTVKQTVKVKYGDTIVPLNFNDNGVKLATGPAPGIPPAPSLPNPAANPFSPFNSGVKPVPVPQRPLRFQAPGVPGPPGQSSYTPPGAPVGGGPPGLNVNGANLSFVNPQAIHVQDQENQLPPMRPDEYGALLEVQREMTKNDVMNGSMPPLPTTRYTPPGALGSLEEAPTQTPTPNNPQYPMRGLPGRPLLLPQ